MVFSIACPPIRVRNFLLNFLSIFEAFGSYRPSLKSYGLPKMNNHKILQAVFVTGNIKATGRLSQNGWVTTTLSLPTAAKAAESLI
jgi:hypothetical protein